MRQIKEFLPDIKEYYYITKDGDVVSRARTQEGEVLGLSNKRK